MVHRKKTKSPKKKYSWSFKVLFSILVLVVLQQFCYQATAGFQVIFIQTPKAISPLEHEIINQPPPEELRSRLEQPFYFLGSGAQCYAFVSEDQSYVLKVFKQHNFFIPNFLTTCSSIPLLGSPCQKLILSQKNKREDLIRSCLIAGTDWSEETGTLYLHLATKNDLDFSLTLIDKLKISHILPAGNLQFVVQRKANLVTPTLAQLKKEGRHHEAEECVRSLISLIIKRCEKGIGDRDPVIRRNFGFIGTRAVEIDIGSYYFNPFLKSPPLYTRDVYFEIHNLHNWLQHHHPELTHVTAKALESFLTY